MQIDLTPDTRRAVMQYAAKENISFAVALECLVIEGVKSICEKSPRLCPLVYKPVDKPCIKLW